MKSFKKYLNAKTRSPEQIAAKHRVSVDRIHVQLRKGIAVEREHSKNDDVAYEIARDHLWERPDYYDKLAKLERS